MTWKGSFFSENETRNSEAWDNIDLGPGTVALSDDYVAQMGLPKAQRFPWDKTKGIYVLNSYHNMHCLIKMRQIFIATRTGHQVKESFLMHALHCLDSLRQSLECHADDTPRYTGFQPHAVSGLGQHMKCRSWDALAAWGRQHSACWQYIDDKADPNFDSLDRYRFCPPNSPYADKVRAAFGENLERHKVLDLLRSKPESALVEDDEQA
ncbi:MAG: hypothetical protein M1821_004193 [Bathelium mastoideum]|nr:MAG: hypothetical protein M1821_004193 [Bathelium mastoideum]